MQSVTIMERSKLPSSPAIYLVYTPLNELLYIGRSDNLFNTWLMHDRFQEFIEAHQETRVAWFEINPESMPIIDLGLVDGIVDKDTTSNDPNLNDNYITKDDWNEFIKELQQTLPAKIRSIVNAEYLVTQTQTKEIQEENYRLKAENQKLLDELETLKQNYIKLNIDLKEHTQGAGGEMGKMLARSQS